MSANPNALMQQAQQTIQNPLSQSVPQMPGQDMSQHPIVQAIIKAISGGAQSYGWTGINPEERMQRQQMDAQKAEAMGRMAQGQQRLGIEQQTANQTGAYQSGELALGGRNAATHEKEVAQTGKYQEGELGVRNKEATIAQQRADQEKTYQTGELEMRRRQLDQGADQIEESIRHNRADEGTARQANDIRRQMIEVDEKRIDAEIQRTGLQGTIAGIEKKAQMKAQAIAELAKAHPWLYGMDSDVTPKVGAIADSMGTEMQNATNQATAKPSKPFMGPQQTPPTTGSPAPEGTVIQGPNGTFVKRQGQWQPQ